MITQHGAQCDVCGKYILGLTENDTITRFRVEGITQELCCHTKCKDSITNAGSDWKQLPDGPLRAVFEETTKQLGL